MSGGLHNPSSDGNGRTGGRHNSNQQTKTTGGAVRERERERERRERERGERERERERERESAWWRPFQSYVD